MKDYNNKHIGEFTEKKGESLNARSEENTDGQSVPQWPKETKNHQQALVEELVCPEKDPNHMRVPRIKTPA